jgi:hypothetical protein
MRDDSSSDAQLIRYLLGDLTDQEQVEIEERAFRDQHYLLEIEAVECDLIDDYVRGALSECQRRQFEDRFFASAERRRKLKFARRLELLQKSSIDSIRDASVRDGLMLQHNPSYPPRQSGFDARPTDESSYASSLHTQLSPRAQGNGTTDSTSPRQQAKACSPGRVREPWVPYDRNPQARTSRRKRVAQGESASPGYHTIEIRKPAPAGESV